MLQSVKHPISHRHSRHSHWRAVASLALMLFTASEFVKAQNPAFIPLTDEQIKAVYDELAKDFEANELFSEAGINRYRDGVRSEWSGYWENIYKKDENGDDTEIVIDQKWVPTNNARPITSSTLKSIRSYAMLDYRPFFLAMKGRNRILSARSTSRDPGVKAAKENLLAVVDFSESSKFRRYYLFDLDNKKVLFNTWTSHGSASSPNKNGYAEVFSNFSETNKSSAGFFVTAETYEGKWGYSRRIRGLDEKLNSNVYARTIVMHGWGMSANMPSATSLGCFMLSVTESGRFYGYADEPLSKVIIDASKAGTILYAHTDHLAQQISKNSEATQLLKIETASKWLRAEDARTVPNPEDEDAPSESRPSGIVDPAPPTTAFLQ